MLIGLPIITIKEYISRKQIYTVPKSNICPVPNNTSSQHQHESIEMETFHSKSRIIHIQPINVIDNDVNDTENLSIDEKSISINESINNHDQLNDPTPCPPITMFNTSKSNKNLINFTGVLLIGVMLIIISYFPFASRMGWISQREGNIYIVVPLCCIPVVLPTIYFMYKPKHLVKVLKDLNLYER